MKFKFNPADNNPVIISFKTMRRLIGIIGILLPLIAIFWTFAISDCSNILETISAYYHTDIRNIFVGILCAVSFFFFSYHGYDYLDFFIYKIVGFFSLGIAFSPAKIYSDIPPCVTILTKHIDLYNVIHLTCATIFFFSLAFISIFLFTKTKPNSKEEDVTIQKRHRNLLYRICGIIIILCLVLSAIMWLLPIDSYINRFSPIFWLETAALFAFGISWLVKGEVMLKDAL